MLLHLDHSTFWIKQDKFINAGIKNMETKFYLILIQEKDYKIYYSLVQFIIKD